MENKYVCFMKSFIVIITLCLSSLVWAENFRYNHMATTGLTRQIADKNGKLTTIKFSPKSKHKALFILDKLLSLQGVSGTVEKIKWAGVDYDQCIFLEGELEQEVLKTKSAPNTAESEKYQMFVLKDLKVRFPLTRLIPGPVFDTGHLETHFSFDTIYPKGLKYKGGKIDLKLHHTAENRQLP